MIIVKRTDIAKAALATAKESAQVSLVSWVDTTTVSITGLVPVGEKLSWDKKEESARAILAGTATSSQTLMINLEARLVEKSVTEVSQKIVGNADKYTSIIAVLSGIRQKVSKGINLAETPSSVRDALSSAAVLWANAQS